MDTSAGIAVNAADSVKVADSAVAPKAGLKVVPKADAAEILKADAAVAALIVEVMAAPKVVEDAENLVAVAVARSSPRQVPHFALRRVFSEAP